MLYYSEDAQKSLENLFYYPCTFGKNLQKALEDMKMIRGVLNALPLSPTRVMVRRFIRNIGTITYISSPSSCFIVCISWSSILTKFYYVKSNFIVFNSLGNIPSAHPSLYIDRNESYFKCDNGFVVVSRKQKVRGREIELFNFKNMDGHIICDIDFTQVKPFDEYKDMTARGYTPDRRCYIVFEDGFKEEVNEQRSISLKKIIKESVNSILNELCQTKYYESINQCKSVVNENKTCPSMLNNRKRIIRLTESDLVNIVLQCLFESTRHTSLLTESAQDKHVQKFLKSKGYSDYNKRMEIIGKTKHDIPNIRLDNDKFLLGCLRMFFDGQLRDEPSYRNVDNALKQIHNDGHTDEFDENLNGKTPDDLYNMFRETIKQNAAKDRERSAKRVFDSGSNYKIIPINSFEEAEPYGQYTSWCVTHGQDAFDTYTTYGNRFYFCLRNDFQNVPKDDENAPINEWGLSMIAVNVDTDGNLTRVTTRYNHDYNGENNPQLETPKQLENVLNVPFYQTFKPYTRQELLDMGVVPFDMVQELLDSGKDPEEIFRYVGDFHDGYARVKLNGKYNAINREGRLVSPTWFDGVGDFHNGYTMVNLNDKYNFINGEGRLVSPTWFDDWDYFENGYARVKLNDKYNVINREGRLLSPTWVDDSKP